MTRPARREERGAAWRSSEMPRAPREAAVVERGVGAERRLEISLRGAAVLRHPRANRGAAFTHAERAELGLEGLLPSEVSTLAQEMTRALATVRAMGSPLAKATWLRALSDRQETLFYALLDAHPDELLPLVYTPTVGEMVSTYDRLHHEPRGLVVRAADVDRIDAIFDAWPEDDVRMIVATDASAILGIGDRGHGGIAIAIGKLALYGLAGLEPATTLPVLLDVGTDRPELLADPLYRGARHRRLRGDAYLDVLDAFVEAVARRFPRAIVQWEDLAKSSAIDVLARYRDVVPSFNDDIQGTGAVALGGLLAACASKGEHLAAQRVVVHGAGAGGAGVARALRAAMVREGVSVDDARARVVVLDSQGLLVEGDPMEAYKRELAAPRALVAEWDVRGARPSLAETAAYVGATALVGVSGTAGAFDEPLVRGMAARAPHPIVFALSNPTSASEAEPRDLVARTAGRAIIATGSPFEPVAYDGRVIEIGQGNNAFVFPGVGLGALAARAYAVTDGMMLEAAYSLADYVESRHLADGLVYPPMRELREVAVHVASRVMVRAVREGAGCAPEGALEDPARFVRERAWVPRHLPVRAT